jgi:hypothetical protein
MPPVHKRLHIHLDTTLTPYPQKGMRRGGETKVREEGPRSHPRPWEASLSTFPSP